MTVWLLKMRFAAYESVTEEPGGGVLYSVQERVIGVCMGALRNRDCLTLDNVLYNIQKLAAS